MRNKTSLTRRELLRLAGMAGVGVALAACAPQASAPTAPKGSLASDTKASVTIFNFGGDNDKKVYNAAYDRFKKRFPNITIDDNFTPVTTWSEYSNKIATQVAGGKAPD